jgi:hypothetical protein
MANEFLVSVLVIGFAAIITVSTLYLVLKLLDWKEKPLPGAHSRIFNIALVSLVTAVAMLLIVDVELIVILPSIKGGLLTLVEEIDLFATAVVVSLIVLVFMLLRGVRERDKRLRGKQH